MKLKGISLVERHFEKGLVLLAVVLVVGIGAWKFVLSANTFDMDGVSGGVAITEIDEKLRERAERIQRGQAENAQSRVVFSETVAQMTAEFTARLAKPVSPVGDLPPNQPSLAAAITPTGSTADTWYYEPKFAAAKMAGVIQTQDAIDPKELDGRPGLTARFPAGGPFDIQWATPWAVLDMRGIRAEVAKFDNAGSPQRAAVPEPWYGGKLPVADVFFERQTMMADGAWGEQIEVEILEGAPSYRDQIAEADAAVREDLLDQLVIASNQMEVLQPHFFETRKERFDAPLPGIEAPVLVDTPERRQSRDLQKRLSRKRNDLTKLEDALRKAGGPLEPDKEPKKTPKDRGTGGGGGGGGGRGGGGGFGGGGDGGSDGGGGAMGGRNTGGGEANDEQARARRISLTKRRSELNSEISKLDASLMALAPGDAAAAPASTDKAAWDLDEVVVWAHDPSVVPGAVYRYRTTVRLFNPFFTRAPMLVSEQAPLADSLIITSATSAWGEPVRIEDPLSFFVTRASAADGKPGSARATIEIYRLFNGERRKLIVTAEPGDAVGGTADSSKQAGADPNLDFSTGWFILDIIDEPTRDAKPGDSAKPAFVLVQKLGSEDPAVALDLRKPWLELDNAKRRLYLDECEEVAAAATPAGLAGDPATEPASRSKLGGN